ncbi:acyltransferase family protein [Polynucleobacter sp.]|uniref:acyltransferase family protein n=1 Tax=Polynucleobacter sp. TaxID=2029855 RepID=UPI003F697811
MNLTYTQESNQGQTKIEELESIRGLAALLIVFCHIPKWNTMLDIGIINNGYLMVELFFVLSGYVIYTAYAEKITNKNDLFRFQFLRFGRLYPSHFVFLLVFIFIEIAKYISQSNIGITNLGVQPFENNNFTAIVQQLFLVQAIGSRHYTSTFNYPAWSISVEFYTYLFFSICVLFAAKRKDLLFSLIAFASFILVANQITFGFESLLICFAGFFIGLLTAIVTKTLKVKIPKYASLLVLVAIISFLQIKTNKQYDVAIYLLTATLIASLVLSKDGYLNYVLNLKALTWLGSISYAMYISHASVLWAIDVFFRRVLNKPTILISGNLVMQLNNIENFIACFALFLIVFPVSFFSYRFIEKPMREKSRRYAFKTFN